MQYQATKWHFYKAPTLLGTELPVNLVLRKGPLRKNSAIPKSLVQLDFTSAFHHVYRTGY